MTLEFPDVGKVDARFFEAVIAPRLGARRPEVLVGPAPGLDNGIVRVAPGRVLAVTTDPLSLIPALGPEDSAWLSVHLLASDLATSGLAPQFAVVDFNLPPHMGAAEFERYWEAMHQEFKNLGIAVVAGHTGRFLGCDYTIIGGGALFALGSEDAYVTPAMARPGDVVLLTKGAAIATTGLLARAFPETVGRALGRAGLERAQGFFRQFSVVEEALAAASVGVRERGARAMHDATEGGVLGALYELAEAAGLGLEVELSRIPVAEETRQICELFEIDPYWALGEGALVVACPPERAPRVREAVEARGVPVAEVGRLLPPQEGRWVVARGERRPLEPPAADPYWAAYRRALERGWR